MFKEFFEKTFAPFFTLAALTVILCPMYLVCIYVNDYPFESQFFTGLTWHSHEMLFAFTPLLLTGFLFTAGAKWTGKKTTSLSLNISLCLVWILGRFAIFSSNEYIALFTPLLFLIIVLVKLFSILKGTRNIYPIGFFLTCLLFAQVIFLGANIFGLDYKDLAYKLASLCIFGIIMLFSGRLIPFFTNSKYKKPIIELNQKTEVGTGIIFLSFYLAFFAGLETVLQVTALLLFACIIYRSIRIFYNENIKVPLLLVLNCAHLWLAFFPFFIFLEIYNPELVIGNLAYHSLFSGALGLFALGIMTRVSLGHSGLELKAPKILVFAFINTIVGSVLRILIPLLSKEVFNQGLHISMGLWTTGFICFLIFFIPIYVSPRKL